MAGSAIATIEPSINPSEDAKIAAARINLRASGAHKLDGPAETECGGTEIALM
ncbi:hypothetical protein KIN_12150 [Litoreibacter roseus]|uniref:Uncharacterized protein n=1 Tax=Litoreibacter roseus TaxID=2601869 RepID=A0A6N6JCS6_9RHOB|nr:hypothetical protein KIN_12150 [Litoreibacter roseus]